MWARIFNKLGSLWPQESQVITAVEACRRHSRRICMGIYRKVNKWLKCIQLYISKGCRKKIISYPDLTLFYTESGRGRSGYKIRKKVHATIPKGNMGYFWHCSCRTYFCCFALALGNRVHGLSCHSFKISMKNRDLKTTHNTFRDCRVHVFRQPFSK